MKVTRTIVLKLAPTTDQATELDATLGAFAQACNHIVEVCRRIDSTNKVLVQRECYKEVRERFGLSANLAIRAIARTCAALKASKGESHQFRPTSIDYDARIFSFCEGNWTVSLTLLFSRQRLATIPGDHQRTILAGTKPTAARLVKRQNGFFLHIQISKQAQEPIAATDHIGIDMGIVRIATTSDDPVGYCGKPVERVRKKHNLQRKRLQRKGTRGAQKKLRRMAGKEARFRRHQNHVISKEIVQSAKDTGRGIALEDLDGIRGRITARGGEARNRLSGWSFHQLRGFITYKALDAGIPVVLIDPHNTSRTCSACGHCEKSNRRSQAGFVCKHCGFSVNADWNAARNIRAQANCKLASGLAIVEAKAGNGTAAEISRKATAL
jgi:IS605 OrfB family transposase